MKKKTKSEIQREFDAMIKKIESDGYKYHHASMARGYVPSESSYFDDYSGRYGTGLKVHVSSRLAGKSNRYHFVWYYLKNSD